VSGDAGFGERLLCLGEVINQPAVCEKEEVSRFSKELLLGKSAAIWDEAYQSCIAKDGSQSRTLCNWAIDE
jgi:hypothetical protein